jgi:hypothetical protein
LSEPPTRTASVFHNFSATVGRLLRLVVSNVTPQRKMAPLKGAIHLAASLGSPVVVMVVMMVMVMTVRLCTWNRAN